MNKVAIAGAMGLLTLLTLLAATPAFAQSRDLTAEQARGVLALAGINPGTVRQVGDLGRFALRSVAVRHGAGRGKFIVLITIEAVP